MLFVFVFRIILLFFGGEEPLYFRRLLAGALHYATRALGYCNVNFFSAWGQVYNADLHVKPLSFGLFLFASGTKLGAPGTRV